MRIVTVVGARPQFIKAAAGSREIRKEHEEILVHTGQHYDQNMSDVFFKEMEIPAPDYSLNISGGTHANMTGQMLMAIEDILVKESPDAVLVYGDTNSTLAAALAAVKLQIPVIHVEAGNRLGTLNNPEEVNRILTDHCASMHFCATENAKSKLSREGINKNVHVIGNIMYDSFLHFANRPWNDHHICLLDGFRADLPESFYYMTCHRQENTASDRPLKEILGAMDSLDAPTIYPVHPRNRAQAQRIVLENGFKHIILVQPIRYSDSVQLTKRAIKIVTDSGGLQCEAFFAGVQCVFVFDYVVWPETMVSNRNQLAKAEKTDILNKLSKSQTIDPSYQPFGAGDTANRICNVLRNWRTDL